MENVLYERQGQVGLLTVNRPEALNALNSSVIQALHEALEEIASSDIRCLIVTGAGEKAFVAGADIAEMKDLSPEQAKRFSEAGNAVMERLENLAMPVIAVVNGYALGGGCELALACDIRIASERSVFGLPETGLGILPGYGGIQRLVRTVGLSKAKELVFTGERLKADQALMMGLVNKVEPVENLMKAALHIAGKIASNAPVGVRYAKQIANRSAGLPLNKASRLEVETFAACFDTNDQRMAMEAFVNKRKPEAFIGK